MLKELEMGVKGKRARRDTEKRGENYKGADAMRPGQLVQGTMNRPFMFQRTIHLGAWKEGGEGGKR